MYVRNRKLPVPGVWVCSSCGKNPVERVGMQCQQCRDRARAWRERRKAKKAEGKERTA